MTKILKFFDIHYPPKLGISIAQQRKMWFVNFLKVFCVVVVGYMAMYFIRNNLKACSGMLKDQLGFTTTQLGQIGLAFSLTYGVGKTLLGYISDGRNTKRILSFLLVLASIVTLLMGILLASKHYTMGFLLLLWGFNGFFQSPGGSLSYATITKWTPRAQRGRWMGLWNISHNLGGAIAGIIALFGANLFFNGHVSGMFIFPAIIALVIGIATLFIGNDSPEELGMNCAEVLFNEPIDPDEVDAAKLSKWKTFLKYVVSCKWIWILCVVNIFVYIIRIGIDNWAPLYTKETFNFSSSQQVNTIFYFEIGALVGSMSWGYISDLLKGRRAVAMIFCFLLTFVGIVIYRYSSSPIVINSLLFFLGTCIFGPQLLVGVSAVCFVPKKAISVANGTTGTFGYLFGDSMAKIGLAVIADPKSNGLSVFGHVLHGWSDTFIIFYISIALAVVLLGFVVYAEEKRIKKLASLATNRVQEEQILDD